MESNKQSEPFTSPLAEAASLMHELFESYVEGGFSEKQSLFLISQLIKNNAEDLKSDEQG